MRLMKVSAVRIAHKPRPWSLVYGVYSRYENATDAREDGTGRDTLPPARAGPVRASIPSLRLSALRSAKRNLLSGHSAAEPVPKVVLFASSKMRLHSLRFCPWQFHSH